MLAHVLEHVAVADRGAGERQAERREIALEAEIRHDGGDDARLASRPSSCQLCGDHRHDLVAVDDVAALVDNHDAVGVAVERDADVGAHLATLAHSAAGAVEPQSLLMLKPSGSTPIAITSAPSSHSASGATW